MKNKKAITAITIVALLIITGGTWLYTQNSQAKAWETYQQTYKTYQKTNEETLTLYNQLKEIEGSCTTQVEQDNQTTCPAITDTLKNIKIEDSEKKLDKKTAKNKLTKTTKTLTETTKALEKYLKQLKNLEKDYNQARLAKTEKDYNNAHDTLDAKIQELQDLINATEGKVTDNKTREEAQNTINNATEVFNQKAGDSYEDKNQAKTQLEQQTQAIQTAIDTLNQNHDAWNQQQAQAAAAQAATRNNTITSANNNYNNYYNHNSGYSGSNNYSSGNTYTPPANNTSGSKSSNNNTSIWDDWTNFDGSEMPCQAVGTCQ